MRLMKWKPIKNLNKLSVAKLEELYDHNAAWIDQQARMGKISAHTEERYIDDLYPITLEIEKRTAVTKTAKQEERMARRSLSQKEIKDGVAYIHNLLVDRNMSAREVAEDPKLPFSLTTYYKYLPKYEKSIKKATVEAAPEEIYDDERTPTKAIAANKKADELAAENQALMDEINTLNRFIVRNFIQGKGAANESSSSDERVH